MIPAPTPCTARAATNSAMSPARPAASSPAAKPVTPNSSAVRGPRRSPMSPPTTMPTTEATRKALNGQAYQARPFSSATAVGMAVATAIDSKAMKVTSMSRPAVGRRCARSKTEAGRDFSTTSPTLRGCGNFPHRRVERRPPGGSALDGACSALAGGDLLGRGGDDGVQVADHAEVGELEDRGLGVLVDGHDGLRGLHAGAVLDRTGDADGDVELRRDGLAGLADLERVRHPARVDRGTRGAHGSTEGVGEAFDGLEVAAGATTAGDDDRGL